MAITETVKLIVAVLIGCALLFMGQKVLEWRESHFQSIQQTRTARAATDIIQDGIEADDARGEVDAAVDAGRHGFEDTYQEITIREPTTADRANRAVPASVRNAFRERRLARERSGCAGGQCVQGPDDTPPPER